MQRETGTTLFAIGQAAVSGLGFVVAFCSFPVSLLLAVFIIITEGITSPDAISPLYLAWTSGLVILLMLPSLIFSIGQLMGKSVPVFQIQKPFLAASITLLVWPLAVMGGSLLMGQPEISLLLLPPLQIFVIGIPIWWTFEAGRNNLRVSNPRRSWGIYDFGLVITPGLVTILEFGGLIILGALLAVLVYSRPDWLDAIQQFSTRIVEAKANTQVIQRILGQYLNEPLVLYSILAIFGGAVPLLEELFKPLALWIVAGRGLTRREGFVLGMLCGGAFALVESLGVLGTPLEGAWVTVVIGRLGTGILHTVNSGLVGYGLASAWGGKSYFQAVGAYLAAVCLHGIWNVFALISGINNLMGATSDGLISRLSTIAPLVLVGMVIGFLGILYVANRQLRTAI